MALLVVGNLALLTVSLYAAESRGRHGTVRHLLTVLPVWWCLLSLATYVAALELLVPSWRPSLSRSSCDSLPIQCSRLGRRGRERRWPDAQSLD